MSAPFPAMDQTSTPITSDMLYDFLASVPNMATDIPSKETERQILTNCYRALWGNDLNLMQKYFFKEGLAEDGSVSTLLEKYNLLHHDDSTVTRPTPRSLAAIEEDGPEYLESQRGKQCGHLFKNGESVYRCRNCGLDDTCVLCARCFHATNHEGHDVKIWISRGVGGCCDCGDPEAWKVPLECRIHSLGAADKKTASPSSSTAKEQKPESQSSIPNHLRTSIRKTITCVMDYIFETFAVSPERSLVHTETNPQNIPLELYDDIIKECENTHNALGLKKATDPEKQSYACVLWNDEKHTFNDVIKIVCRAVKCNKSQASRVAQTVDAHGRHIVMISDDLTELLVIAGQISSIHLAVTIRSLQSIIREEVCGLLLTWLKDLVSSSCPFFSGISGGNHVIRDIICEVLCEDWSLRRHLGVLSTHYRRGRVPEEDQDDEFHDFDEDDTDMEEEEQAAFLQFLGTDINQITLHHTEDEEEVTHDTQESDMNEAENEEDDLYHEEDDEELDDEEEEELEEEQENQDEDEQMHVEHLDEDVVMVPIAFEPHARLRPRTTRPGADAQQTPTSSTPKPPSASHTIKGDFVDLSWDINAWLAREEKIDIEEHNISKMFGTALTSKPTPMAEVGKRLTKAFKQKLRLDYLLQYDLRLWKTARMAIKDLLIGTMISNFDYRPIMGIRFARNYPELVDAFFFKDREPEHSMCTLSVQFLTVPTVASLLVKEYEFFSLVSSIFSNFFLTDHIHTLLPDDYRTMQIDCASRAITRHRYAYSFYDLRYVLNADQVKVAIRQNPRYLHHFIDMLYQFQAMDAFKRRTGVHVEFESTRWTEVFTLTLQISRLCRHFAECYTLPRADGDITAAARDLCRSISRMAKAINDWAPQPPPSLEQTEKDLMIKGVNEQRFHRVQAYYAGPFDVVEYDVAKEPVSFHHPFHWFLSGLLEHISLLDDDLLMVLGFPGGLKEMMYNATANNATQDVPLIILEYPLRVMVLLAQITCGVWVRNGFTALNQARTYRDIGVRQNTLDKDIYLLQVGFVLAEPDKLLLTMLDRFNLLEWFGGMTDKTHEIYDRAQLRYIVEEFLYLLIVCANERGFAANLTVEDKIRRAISQYLGISSMAYSELVGLIPDSLSEHTSFESILGSLTNFKAPDGLNDHGVYELKDEYYDEIDPYYWHFGRNQREEALASLRKRWNNKNPDRTIGEDDEFFAVSTPKRIDSGPLRSLGLLFQSRVLCQIIFYALWNTRSTIHTESYIIVDEALHLAMLAVLEEESDDQERKRALVKGKFPADMTIEPKRTFVQNAVEDEYRVQVSEIERERITLLKLLLRCLDDKNLKQIHKRCMFIVNKIDALGSPDGKELINQWRESSEIVAEDMHRSASNARQELERKKAAAKARQQAILDQFAQAQSRFMAYHGELYEDEDEGTSEEEEATPIIAAEEERSSDEIERICHFPSGACIVCQEQLDHTKVYGMLGLIQLSRIQRQTPLKDADIFVDILEKSQENALSEGSIEKAFSQNKKSEMRGFPTESQVPGLHVSSCGHLIHADCFQTLQLTSDREILRLLRTQRTETKKRFLCPLCKALGNTLLPVVWKGKKESFPGVMATQTPYDTLGQNVQEAIMDLKEKVPGEPIPGAYIESVEEDKVCAENGLNINANSVDQLTSLNVQLIDTLYTVRGNNDVMQYGDTKRTLYNSLLQMHDMYAYTLAATEIAQRGVQTKDSTVEHTGTFLDGISVQTQTLLKLLSKINGLLPKVMNTNWLTDDKQEPEKLALNALSTLIYDPNAESADSPTSLPVLCDDPFRLLVRLGFVAVDRGLEAHHLMRILLLAEFAKTTIALLQSLTGSDMMEDPRVIECLSQCQGNICAGEQEAKQFATSLMELLQVPPSFVDDFFKQIGPSVFAALLRTFTLPYLRRCLLWMVVHHGFILQNDEVADLQQDEYEHLLQTLCLPQFDKLFDLTPFEVEILSRWCNHYTVYSQTEAIVNVPEQAQAYIRLAPLSLHLPIEFSMVSLPYRMDQLFTESLKRICKKCHSVPEFPALCLVCGTFVCAQRLCCTEDERGECNQHMRSCSGEYGIFMIINKCFILLLHDSGGTHMNAPYLDSHGEVDFFLKHGTPQYLNDKRYEQIRQMWLSHSVAAFVRRGMDVTNSLASWDSW